jgi:uncharacterized protein (DUF1697 family)
LGVIRRGRALGSAIVMAAYVALLRGINVGKAKRVPMADLRALLIELGLTSVATLLNSGNAVFHAPAGASAAHAAAIASRIAAKLHLQVPVIVKSAKELVAIAAGNPLTGKAINPTRVLVAFTQDPATLSRLAPIRALVRPPERFVIGRNAAYFHCPDGILKSEAAAGLLGKLAATVTTRNWATVQKLLACAGASGA